MAPVLPRAAAVVFALSLSVAHAGTLRPFMVKDIATAVTGGSSYPTSFVATSSSIFFAAVTPETGYELWKSDGTAAGTTMVVTDFAASDDTRTGPDFTVITEDRAIKGKRVKN